MNEIEKIKIYFMSRKELSWRDVSGETYTEHIESLLSYISRLEKKELRLKRLEEAIDKHRENSAWQRKNGMPYSSEDEELYKVRDEH